MALYIWFLKILSLQGVLLQLLSLGSLPNVDDSSFCVLFKDISWISLFYYYGSYYGTFILEDSTQIAT